MQALATRYQKLIAGLGDLPGNMWVVTAVSFLTDISSEMVINLIPLFLANVLHVRIGIIGLIEGVADTTASLLKIFSGWLSDRLGQRKWLTVAGYSLSTVAKPFLYFAVTWEQVLGVRFTDRMGKGIRTAPRDALIADSIDERRRGVAFGLHRAGDTAGAVIGLMIALGVIWAVQGAMLTLNRSTFQLIVLLSIIPAVLAVLILVFGVHDVPAELSSQVRLPLRLSWRGFTPYFRSFLSIVIIFTLGNSADAFLILRAQERGLSVLGVMGMLVAFNLVYSLVSGPAGILSDKIGRRWLIGGGWLAYSLIYLGFALAKTTWHIVLFFILYGLYYGLTDGVAKAMVADLVLPAQRGTAYGVYNAGVGLTAFTASFIAGVLWQGVGNWQGFGPQAPFFFGSGLALIAAILLVLWLPQMTRRAVEF